MNKTPDQGIRGGGRGKALVSGRAVMGREGGVGLEVEATLPGVGGTGEESILVVDDEELVRMVIRTVLAHRGYGVTEARDGEEAVRKCQEFPGHFSVVLIDQRMPNLTGAEALVRIRKVDPWVKAILLSGGPEERESPMMRGLDGVEFLSKPFDNNELLCKVSELVELRRKERR